MRIFMRVVIAASSIGLATGASLGWAATDESSTTGLAFALGKTWRNGHISKDGKQLTIDSDDTEGLQGRELADQARAEADRLKYDISKLEECRIRWFENATHYNKVTKHIFAPGGAGTAIPAGGSGDDANGNTGFNPGDKPHSRSTDAGPEGAVTLPLPGGAIEIERGQQKTFDHGIWACVERTGVGWFYFQNDQLDNSRGGTLVMYTAAPAGSPEGAASVIAGLVLVGPGQAAKPPEKDGTPELIALPAPGSSARKGVAVKREEIIRLGRLEDTDADGTPDRGEARFPDGKTVKYKVTDGLPVLLESK